MKAAQGKPNNALQKAEDVVYGVPEREPNALEKAVKESDSLVGVAVSV